MRIRKRNSGSAATPALLSLIIVAMVAITVFVFASNFPWAVRPAPSHRRRRRSRSSILSDPCGDRHGFHPVATRTGLRDLRNFAIMARKRISTRGSNTLEADMDHCHHRAFSWTWLDGTQGLGGSAVHACGAGRDSGGSHRQPVRFQFPLSGAGRKIRQARAETISASTGNPLGLDPNDPAGKDDIVVPTLTVPVNRQVELLIRSQDVIHNFFVRELRLQQDAVPGMVIPMHFTPNAIGQYEIVCTQLCGLGHYRMHSYPERRLRRRLRQLSSSSRRPPSEFAVRTNEPDPMPGGHA